MNTKEIESNPMICKTFRDRLPDLVLTANARPSVAAVAHMRNCPPCAEEYVSFRNTFAALDDWRAPEPTLYFDQRMAVRLREEQAAPKMNWMENLRTRLLLNTGPNFRPAMVSALGLALVLGGGGIASVNYGNPPAPPQASAAVDDLQILDRNEQAFQQLDELQDENNATEPGDTLHNNEDAAPSAPPAS